jgi:hypothetical protein
MIWTQAAVALVGVAATFGIAAYTLRANRLLLESNRKKADAETTGVHLDNQAKQIRLLQEQLDRVTVELAEQRRRRLDERDELQHEIDTSKARIAALEAFIRLNTEYDPTSIN